MSKSKKEKKSYKIYGKMCKFRNRNMIREEANTYIKVFQYDDEKLNQGEMLVSIERFWLSKHKCSTDFIRGWKGKYLHKQDIVFRASTFFYIGNKVSELFNEFLIMKAEKKIK